MATITSQISSAGAVIDILVGLSVPDFQRLRRSLQMVPHPISLRAVLDTGSPLTCIDPLAFRPLGLMAVNTISVLTASSGATPLVRDQYPVSLTILPPSGDPRQAIAFGSILVTDANLAPTGDPALVGCDLLKHCTFVYDGRRGIFSLEG